MKRVRLRCLPGVDPAVRDELHRVVRGFNRLCPVRHDVWVLGIPHPCFEAPDGLLTWGCFAFPMKRRGRLRIGVAAQVPKRDGRRSHVKGGHGKNGAARVACHTLLHELAHYEQYRDRRPMVERGVNVRAKSLYRQIGRLES